MDVFYVLVRYQPLNSENGRRLQLPVHHFSKQVSFVSIPMEQKRGFQYFVNNTTIRVVGVYCVHITKHCLTSIFLSCTKSSSSLCSSELCDVDTHLGKSYSKLVIGVILKQLQFCNFTM